MATSKNFVVKNGLEVGGQEVINSSGVVTSAALGGQTLGTTDNPTFANLTLTGYLAGPSTFTIDPAGVGDNTGTLVIAGNLQVDGTTTTINSTTMEVDDLNITLASGAANAAAANGAGLTIDGASATLTYNSTADGFSFNKDLDVTGTVTADGLTLDNAGGINSDVTSLSLTVAGGNSDTDGGNITFYGSTNGAGSRIRFRSDSTERMRIESNGDISFYEDTGTTPKFFWDASAERLGIGTTSPASDLHVVGNSLVSGGGGYYLNALSGTDRGYVGWSTGAGMSLWNVQNSFMQFGTNNTERMRIDSSGNVGIGTTSPVSKLSAQTANITAGSTDFSTIGFASISPIGAVSKIATMVAGYDSTAIFGTAIGFAYNGSGYEMMFATNNNLSGNPTERMRITSAGNVGIGTSSPAAPLEVSVASEAPSGGSSRNGSVFFNSAGNSELAIGIDTATSGRPIWFQGRHPSGSFDSTRYNISLQPIGGSVGIGTTSPAVKLHVNGDILIPGSSQKIYGSATTGNRSYIEMYNVATGDMSLVTTYPTASVIFGTNSAERMRIDSSGNLLVGTTSTSGSASNAKPVVAGAFRSLNGELTSLASGTAYTMFTAPADFATWIVNVHGIVSNSVYSETAIVQVNNTSVRVDIISAGSLVAISNSGTAIQVTQNAGGPMNSLVWSAFRMA